MIRSRLFIIAFYLALTLAGGALSLHIYQQTETIEKEQVRLLEQQIPELQSVSLLAQAFTEHERILFEYYATENQIVLRRNLQANYGVIQRELASLQHRGLSESILEKIQADFKHQQQIAEQLIVTLSNKDDGSQRWDKARALLEQMTQLGNGIRPLLNQLVEQIKATVQQTQQQNAAQLHSMSSQVAIFSAIILAIAIATGLVITTRLKEAKEKKRLAMFVERNPNPVASFDWQGDYRYRNPAWNQLREKLRHDLLPDDFLQQLEKLKTSNLNHRHWQQTIGDRIFLATLHKQQEVATFTLYLEDITQRRLVEKELEYLAFNDSLTELSNRRKLELDAEAFLDRHPDGVLAVVVIGIDRFNQVTATHGYQVGDQIIIAVKDRIQQSIVQFSAEDYQINLYRFTGAKFVLLIRGQDSEQLKTICHLIVRQIQQSMLNFIANQHGHFYLRLSFGVAYRMTAKDTFIRTLQNADAAFTVARKQNGNRLFEFSESMANNEKRWLEMEVALRQAYNEQQFFLMYQPKVCSSTRTFTGIEALIRWQHPSRGFISPAEFIPIAEQSGLIIEIGEWILTQACRQTRQWLSLECPNMVCAVNISPVQFLQPNFLACVRQALEQSGLPPQNLELEITEGVLMNDVDRSIQILNELHQMGIRIAIDDFGTGYSSLAYLKAFAIDKLKIDKSFIDQITRQKADQSIVKAIIELAKNLDLKVIAEGVETEAQVKLLTEYGCDEIQGYYFSKPLLPEELPVFIEKTCKKTV
jgi:diguanylate cyclase (GGDEF)-like protein